MAQKTSAAVSFCAIGGDDYDVGLMYGLSDEQLRRRLYAIDGKGEMLSGVDAFIAIYRELPRYRRLACFIASPIIWPMAALFYDGVCVPLLARWNGLSSRG